VRDEPFGRHRVAATSDVDEAEAALGSVFLPVRILLRKGTAARPLDMALNAVSVGNVTASYLRFGRHVRINTADCQNYHLNFPLQSGTCSRSGRLERVHSTPERAAVFMPDLPADIDWRDDCTQFCLMFPRHILQVELEAMLDRPLTEPIRFAPAMDLTTELGRAWQDALHLVERQSRYEHGLLDHPLAVGNLERLLVDGLLLAQPHNYTDAFGGPRRPAAPPAVRHAIELMRSDPGQSWSTSSLARRSALSVRSLQDGFHRSVGVPPMRYLRDVRLDLAHDDLQAADWHSVTVAEVAHRWGFVNLGRFASAYHERFGELPSKTLRSTTTHPTSRRRRTRLA